MHDKRNLDNFILRKGKLYFFLHNLAGANGFRNFEKIMNPSFLQVWTFISIGLQKEMHRNRRFIFIDVSS